MCDCVNAPNYTSNRFTPRSQMEPHVKKRRTDVIDVLLSHEACVATQVRDVLTECSERRGEFDDADAFHEAVVQELRRVRRVNDFAAAAGSTEGAVTAEWCQFCCDYIEASRRDMTASRRDAMPRGFPAQQMLESAPASVVRCYKNGEFATYAELDAALERRATEEEVRCWTRYDLEMKTATRIRTRLTKPPTYRVPLAQWYDRVSAFTSSSHVD